MICETKNLKRKKTMSFINIITLFIKLPYLIFVSETQYFIMSAANEITGNMNDDQQKTYNELSKKYNEKDDNNNNISEQQNLNKEWLDALKDYREKNPVQNGNNQSLDEN